MKSILLQEKVAFRISLMQKDAHYHLKIYIFIHLFWRQKPTTKKTPPEAACQSCFSSYVAPQLVFFNLFPSPVWRCCASSNGEGSWQLIFAPTPIFGHKLWVVSKRIRWQKQARFKPVCSVVEFSLRVWVWSVIQKGREEKSCSSTLRRPGTSNQKESVSLRWPGNPSIWKSWMRWGGLGLCIVTWPKRITT